MATYIQKGDAINYKNEGSNTIKYGDVVVLTDRIGIAARIFQFSTTSRPLPTARTLPSLGVFTTWPPATMQLEPPPSRLTAL